MTTPTIMANNYDNYWVSVTYDDYDICGDVDTINVKLIPTASLNLPIDTTICHNESLILSASKVIIIGINFIGRMESINLCYL